MTEIFYESTALWETALQMVWKRAPKGIEDKRECSNPGKRALFFLFFSVDKYLNVLYIYSNHFMIYMMEFSLSRELAVRWKARMHPKLKIKHQKPKLIILNATSEFRHRNIIVF